MSAAFGRTLKSLRDRAGLTVAQAANRADTSAGYLIKLEEGAFLPTSTYTRRITAVYAAAIAAPPVRFDYCPPWCIGTHYPTDEASGEVHHEAGDMLPADVDVQCTVFRFDDVGATGVDAGPTYVQLGFISGAPSLAQGSAETLRAMARELEEAAESMESQEVAEGTVLR
ncbi:helix-turn-helix domain-containing protein [Rathayibacter sp. ZW T2_19]|uniref:Helix-turn-helix domain-containing protein n=1 Tax=Rathayibacter rubneri TaxID=2950106 RepID=A0A9X2DYJ1_9MICO|nr:helix-turn-helix transcriptional regulator [Rathayibacter rubneri]MCM6761416.1 helix-turn-helix domain-containing protein [Rathayibacter rubneri]